MRTTMAALSIAAAIGMSGHALADSNQALIDDALSAGPASITINATIKDWSGNTLRAGTNGYTCFPTPPDQPGKSPMCLDATWLAWADAWMNKKPFKATAVGIAYMLAGDGAGSSNIDPFAVRPTADNQWVTQGPHLMIVLPDAATLKAMPTDPNTGGPYVMWKGTPYAHIMMPIAEEPDPTN